MIKDMENVIVYHGTSDYFKQPILQRIQKQRDFGNGFYVTTDKAQAESYAKRKIYENNSNKGYTHQFVLTDFKGLNVLEFSSADVNWLKTICKYRSTREKFDTNNQRYGKYDIIIGKIADDNTRKVLDAYMRGLYDNIPNISPEEIVINKLQTDRLKNQICLKSRKALSKLKYIKSPVVILGR